MTVKDIVRDYINCVKGMLDVRPVVRLVINFQYRLFGGVAVLKALPVTRPTEWMSLT